MLEALSHGACVTHRPATSNDSSSQSKQQELGIIVHSFSFSSHHQHPFVAQTQQNKSNILRKNIFLVIYQFVSPIPVKDY